LDIILQLLDKFIIKIFESHGIPLPGKFENHLGEVPFPHTNFGVKDDLIMSIKVPYVYQNLALKKLKLFGWMLSVVKG